jgi:hypothetical protein
VAEQEDRGVNLPIEWVIPEHIMSRYATNLVVQQTPHEFILSFFEAHPPVILGSPEERKATLERLKSIQVQCVARIIVAKERMPEFVKVLQEHLARSHPRTGESE